jgi:hypothetical protein
MSRKPVDYYTDQYGTHPIFESTGGDVTGQDIAPNSVTTSLTDTTDLNVTNTTTVNDIVGTTGSFDNLTVSGTLDIAGAVHTLNNLLTYQTDGAGFTVGTSFVDTNVWSGFTCPANAVIAVNVFQSWRNNSTSWGGGYFDMKYRIDGGDWVTVGNTGYQGMQNGNASIDNYTQQIVLDFSAQTTDFNLEITYMNRSYDGSLLVGSTAGVGQGEFALSKLTAILLSPIKTLKGETGDVGAISNNTGVIIGNTGDGTVIDETRVTVLPDKWMMQQWDGAVWQDAYGMDGGGFSGLQDTRGVFHIQHTVAPGVNAGSTTGGVWNTGPLNTVKTNTMTGASLDTVNNTFTLPAGKYRLQGFRGLFYANAYATRIWNITDSKTELLGMNGYADQGDGYNSEHIPFQGIIEIDAPKVFRVEVYCQSAYADTGWGFNTNTYGGEDRVWADFLIEDIQELTGPEGKPGTIESNSGFYVGNTDTPTSGDKRVEVTNSKIGVQEWDGSQWVDRVGFNNDTMIGTAATDIPTLHIRHQVGASEDSGAIPTATWTTRPFNVEQWNTIPNSDLDTQNGYFFLPAGSYVIEAQLEAFRVDDFTSRLYNNTTGEVVLIGTKGYTEQAGGYANDQSYVRGAFNLSQDSWLQLQMYTSNSQAGANQMGRGSSDLDGQASVHAEAIIQTRTALKGDKGDTGLITDNEGAIISGNTIIESSGNLTVDGGDLNVNGTFNMQGSRYPMIWVQPANPTVSDGEDGDLWFVI